MNPLHKASAALCLMFALISQACVAAVPPPATPSRPLRVAVAYGPKTLNPALATDAASARLLQLTHPALLKLNNLFQPDAWVGTCTTQAGVVTCTLPQGKTYTDGTPLTAASVATWYQALQGNALSPFSGALKGISITTPSPYSVTFSSTIRPRLVLQTLTEVPLANPSATTAGLGAFQASEPDPLGQVTLIRTTAATPLNDARTPPFQTALTFIPLPDPTTRLLKLQKGEVDVVLNDIPPELFQYISNKGFPTAATPSTSYSYLVYNAANPYLQNPLVRKAIAQAINRADIRNYLLGGLAAPASTLLPPTHPLAWQAPEESYDPLEAEDTLDSTPYLRGPDNTRFPLEILTSTDALSQRVAQVIQSQLGKVGIVVTLRPAEWASFYESLKKGTFDVALSSWTGAQPPQFLHAVFHSSQTPPNGLNRGRWNSPALNTATEAILNATTDDALATATLKSQQIQADERPYLPLYRRHHTLATAKNLTNCQIDTEGTYRGILECRAK